MTANGSVDKDQTSSNQSILHEFLNHTLTPDNCLHRKSYNKNEKREGFHHAEIVDYLIAYNNTFDPINVFSGDSVDIYIKARFHEPVEFPSMGIAIKTMDGILIYGFNSFYTKNKMPTAQKGDILVGKFSINLRLRQGDYFIDLGVDLKETETSSQYKNLDRRCAAVHLKVMERNKFFGLADFEADFEPIYQDTLETISKTNFKNEPVL